MARKRVLYLGMNEFREVQEEIQEELEERKQKHEVSWEEEGGEPEGGVELGEVDGDDNNFAPEQEVEEDA